MRKIPYVILRVSDGDTIRVRVGKEEIKVRLYGIDAPEMKQAGGRQGQIFLEDLILTESVRIETLDKDKYGREVSLVILPDGTLAQDHLMAAGKAWVYTKYCRIAKCKEWKQMEKTAKASRLGIWRDDNAVPPWEWRKTDKEQGR